MVEAATDTSSLTSVVAAAIATVTPPEVRFNVSKPVQSEVSNVVITPILTAEVTFATSIFATVALGIPTTAVV